MIVSVNGDATTLITNDGARFFMVRMYSPGVMVWVNVASGKVPALLLPVTGLPCKVAVNGPAGHVDAGYAKV
jgi:hypothetical protein